MEVKVPLDIKPGEVRCPRCFRRDIVPSRPHSFRDRIMGWFHRTPWHCRSCGKRFYARRKRPENGGDSRPEDRDGGQSR